MRFAPEQARAPKATLQSALRPGLRLLVVLYWLASLGLGYVRLRAGDFSRRAFSETVTVWYVEALAFLAVFGGAALIVGVLSRQPREKRGARLTDPLDTTTLSAIERHRAH